MTHQIPHPLPGHLLGKTELLPDLILIRRIALRICNAFEQRTGQQQALMQCGGKKAGFVADFFLALGIQVGCQIVVGKRCEQQHRQQGYQKQQQHELASESAAKITQS